MIRAKSKTARELIGHYTHAKEIQQRRVDSGKRGYAKAVRRFMKRYDAFGVKTTLPVRWACTTS